MLIKTKLLFITSTLIILNQFSCQSPEQIPDDAFELARQDKMALDAYKANDTSYKPEKPQPSIQKEATIVNKEKAYAREDDWVIFTKEVEAKIRANTSCIENLQKSSRIGDKQRRRIAHLERDNKAIIKAMNEYIEDMRMRLANFKIATKHDVNQIEIELNDLVLKNK